MLLSEEQVQRVLKAHHIRRFKAPEVLACLQAPALPVAPGTAEAAQAQTEAMAAKVEGAEVRIAVDAQTAAVENSVRMQQAAQQRAAEQAGQRDAAKERTQAELEAQRDIERAKVQERVEVGAAAEEVADAVAEHQSSVQAATSAQAEADRIRRRADKLTDDADLP